MKPKLDPNEFPNNADLYYLEQRLAEREREENEEIELMNAGFHIIWIPPFVEKEEP